MRGRRASDSSVQRFQRSDWWGVVLEAPDGPALARFYSNLLGWPISHESEDGAAVAPDEGVAYLGFQSASDYVRPAWPTEPDKQKMILHLDFEVSDLAAAVGHARELGAVEAEFQPQDNVRVMLDPAGHPFCLYRGDD